jgi:cell cycle sensor histidine kinase DivJ
LKSTAKVEGDWREGLSAACERLVHPRVTDPAERSRQGRLIGLLLAAPFLAGTLVAQLLHGTLPTATMLAAVCSVFVFSWMGAVALALSGRGRLVGTAAVATLCALIGAALAATGMTGSPLLLLLAVPPFEMAWLNRSRGAMIAGWWAAAGAFALGSAATVLGHGAASSFAEHLWLVPLAYGATLWLRTGGSDREQRPVADPDAELARRSGAVILRVNDQGGVERLAGGAGALFGVNEAMLSGPGLFERLQVTDRVTYLTAMDRVRETGEAAEVDLRVRTAGGANASGAAHRLLRFRLVADSGRPGVLMMVRDCEEAEALRRALARARSEADGIEIAKGRFLASVSHELRTPLNAIIGFADMLANEMFGPFNDPRQKEYARLIGDSGQHLLSVVNAILDVSKIESGHYDIEPEPFRFAEALDMCFSMMVLQARAKDISLVRTMDGSVGEICADRRAVQQILINLVSNAVKFTPEGGTIEVAAEVKDGKLVFRVRDNGIGMTREDLDRVGRPFIQVNNAYTRQYDGTGLGLSLVKGLVALHDGAMEIDSAPELGTVVTIRLPLAGPASAAMGAQKDHEACRMEPEHAAARLIA